MIESDRDVTDLYLEDGLGHLTPAGHGYLAESIASCLLTASACPME